MKIIFLFFFIGSVITSSENYFFDIIYNKEYEVDVNKFPMNYIPENAGYYFRSKVDQNGKMQIEIKVLKNAIIEFKLDVCAFFRRPSDIQVLTHHDSCMNGLQGKKDNSDSIYDKYLYDIETTVGANYLVIHLQNYFSLNYLSVNLFKK